MKNPSFDPTIGIEKKLANMSGRYKNVTAGKCFISVEDKIYTTESFALVFSIWYYRIKKIL